MQNGIPVGLRSSPSFGLSRSGQLTAIIQSLFWDGSQGWWYDDDDLTTLFQNSAGTTPVTAVEQFVGLQLDKSRGLVLGPQLFTDFTTEGTWTDNGNGSWSITSAVGTQDLRVDYVGTTNKRYVITVTVSGHSGSQLTIYPLNTAPYTAGNGSFTTRENSNAGFFIIRASSGASATVSNISIRELPGNHRYAPASGNRPIWSKRVNLLTKTEQFDDAYWTKTGLRAFGSGSVANATTAPDGTVTADFICEDTSNGVHGVAIPYNTGALWGSMIPGLAYRCSVFVKPSTRTKFSLFLDSYGGTGSASVNVTLTGNGSIDSQSNVTNPTIALAEQGFYRVSFTMTSNSILGGLFCNMRNDAGNTSYVGDGTSGIFIWGADLRPANQATGLLPLYQRVNTSSDYDTNGFPGYLKADGVDDFLQTNSIDFTATDKITLCAGVRKLSDAGSIIAEPGGGALNTFSVINGFGLYTFVSRGSSIQSVNSPSNYFSPITNVVTGIGAISTDTCLLRINGTQVASNTGDQGTGNFGNYPAYFFRRGGTTLPFTGNEYANIAVGKLLTADQLTALETYMNGLTKAY